MTANRFSSYFENQKNSERHGYVNGKTSQNGSPHRFDISVQQRYILAFMLFGAFFTGFSLRGALSIAITQMVAMPIVEEGSSAGTSCPQPEAEKQNASVLVDLARLPRSDSLFDWSQELQGFILSAFFWGYAITHVPGAVMIQKFGAKIVLSLGILVNAILSIATPAGIYLGKWTNWL